MKRFLALAVVVLMLSALVMSNGGAALAEGEHVTLEFWMWSPQWQQVFDRYTETVNPNISVEMVSVAAEDYVTKLQTTLASGAKLPDIAVMEIGWRGTVINMDIWEDLTQSPYNLDPADMLDGELPKAKDSNGVVRGIECSGSNPGGLAYRRDLALEYFGTDDPEELEKLLPSWDAFYDAGLEVKSKSGGKTFMMTGAGDLWTVLEAQSAAPRVDGGKLLVRENMMEAFEILSKYTEAEIIDKIGMWSPPWNASYAEGNHIFYPFTHWAGPYVIELNDPEGAGNWGIMASPEAPFIWGGTLFGITNQSEHKEEAWEILKWTFWSADSTAVRDEIWSIPFSAYKPSYDTEIWQEYADKPNPYYKDQLVTRKLEAFLPNLQGRPLSVYDAVITNALNDGVTQINSGMSAAEAMDGVVKDILRNVPELSE